MQNGDLIPEISFEPCSIAAELKKMTEVLNEGLLEYSLEATNPPVHDVKGDYLLIGNATEAVYKVPQNTTLVEVFGPVGENSEWEGYGSCYASFDPKPSWWNGLIPVSSAQKLLVNMKNQTVFLLPIDPAQEFTLRVGAPANESCPISGIRTYPFHL